MNQVDIYILYVYHDFIIYKRQKRHLFVSDSINYVNLLYFIIFSKPVQYFLFLNITLSIFIINDILMNISTATILLTRTILMT